MRAVWCDGSLPMSPQRVTVRRASLVAASAGGAPSPRAITGARCSPTTSPTRRLTRSHECAPPWDCRRSATRTRLPPPQARLPRAITHLQTRAQRCPLVALIRRGTRHCLRNCETSFARCSVRTTFGCSAILTDARCAARRRTRLAVISQPAGVTETPRNSRRKRKNAAMGSFGLWARYICARNFYGRHTPGRGF